jgi:hypothetical protein
MNAHSKPLAIPQCLAPYADHQRWVVWKWEDRIDKNGEVKKTKPPFRANGGRLGSYAHNDKPQTWATLPEAVQVAQRRQVQGVGLQLLNLTGFAAIDLDNVRQADGSFLPWAADLIGGAGSYAEFTPSGNGGRILGTVPHDSGSIHKKWEHPEGGQFEIYAQTDTGRYITVTGDRIEGKPDALADLSGCIGHLLSVVEDDQRTKEKSPQLPLTNLAAPKPLVNAIPQWALDKIADGQGDRSSNFQSAVNSLRNCGCTIEDAQRLFEQHPQGSAGKYIEGKRLPDELRRSWQKAADASGKRAAVAAVTGIVTPDAADMVKNSRGQVVWCADNASTMLEATAVWSGVVAFDEFAGLPMLLKPIPGSKTPAASFKPRPLTDVDITFAVRWYNRSGFPDATKTGVHDALMAFAEQTIISPVRHYLEALQWDGHARINSWLTEYCGAEDRPLTRKMGAAWLVSAVARALQPGCKADHALVLEGRQGAGKSSALRTLAGEAWFFDGLHDLHSKDASAGLRGKWIVELPELSAMRRSDVEAVKAFLSRTEERFRPAYGRSEVIEPRRVVFAGTTNRADYLSDDTGNRRFWPVRIERADLDYLARDRDQLWAEAARRYHDTQKWWLDREGEAEAALVVSQRTADDPWEADVLTIVRGLREVSTRDVFERMSIDLDRRSRPDAFRIVGILTRAGWRNAGKFKSGASRDLTRYIPPGSQE